MTDTTNFTYSESEYRIYTDYPQDHIFNIIKTTKSFYELRVLEKIKSLGLKGTAIDVGANIGNHTIFLSRECFFDKILAFEASPDIFNILYKNIVLNDCRNVKALNLAIGSNNKSVGVSELDDKNIGMCRVTENGIIKQVNLDLYSSEEISLIKIDTEGYEMLVLEGSVKILEEQKPKLFIECQSNEEFNSVNNFLLNFGYKTDKINYARTPTYLWT